MSSKLITSLRKSQPKFFHWLDFLLAMTEKEIKARYKHAVLGFLWVILNPLLQMLVMGFIFQFFVPVKVDNYFLFLFTGLLPWNFFSITINKTTPVYVFERFLIAKAKFPRESIVLSIVLSNLFHFLVSLAIFLPVVLIFTKVNLLKLLVLPFAILWLSILVSAISLLTASLNVKYRDINFFVKALLPLWFYATPIVYSLDLIPQNLHFLFQLNPLATIIQTFQFSLLDFTYPSWIAYFLSLFISLVIIFVGIYIFKKESPYFDDWL